jgi:predicted ribosome quality control (RQC) complex YloA/Tae2 family protein
MTILVGKNKHDNDRVTFELGRPHDFWFHAEHFAGSHVVLQWNPASQVEPQMEDFASAADYAAYFSKGKELCTVPVQICRVCDVEKAKPRNAGRVECSSYYVMQGKPSTIRKTSSLSC